MPAEMIQARFAAAKREVWHNSPGLRIHTGAGIAGGTVIPTALIEDVQQTPFLPMRSTPCFIPWRVFLLKTNVVQ